MKLIDFLGHGSNYSARLKSECLEIMSILALNINDKEFLTKIETLESKYHEAKNKLLEVNKEIDNLVKEWGK